MEEGESGHILRQAVTSTPDFRSAAAAAVILSPFEKMSLQARKPDISA